MAASQTLSELVVREWLYETALPAPRPYASTGYWRFTKHRVTQGRRTGNTGRAAENVVRPVRKMDHDAVVREAEIGRSLAGTTRCVVALCHILGLISPVLCHS